MSYKQVFGYSNKMKMTEEAHPGTIFRNFSLPANEQTCKFCLLMREAAAEGKEPSCYAQHNRMAMPIQQRAYNDNLEMVTDGTVWARISQELTSLERTAAKQGKEVRIRVHDSGDFFSREYLQAWLDMAWAYPGIIFYAYTKAVGWVKGAYAAGQVPSNFRFVFSMGSVYDCKLTEADRIAAVFKPGRAVPDGWHDGSHDDYWASEQTGNVYLRYHGSKANAFEAIPGWVKIE